MTKRLRGPIQLQPKAFVLKDSAGRALPQLNLSSSLEVTIGRHPENAIVLDDAWVSRRHAVVSLRQEENGLVSLVIRDGRPGVPSLNGTLVRLADAGLEEGGVEEGILGQVRQMIRQPQFLRQMQEQGRVLRFDRSALDGQAGRIEFSEGALIRLDPADLPKISVLLHAQPGVNHPRLESLGVAGVFPLSEQLDAAIEDLASAQARRGGGPAAV